MAVTFTAKVTGTPVYGATPAGPVSFMSGSTLLGTGALDGSGNATFSTALPTGKYNVKAVYAGSAAYTGSASAAVSVTVK